MTDIPTNDPGQHPNTDKMIPAATLEDQEAILNEEFEHTVMGTPPFSSPDPVTDSIKMLPLEDGTSAHQASLEAAEIRDATTAQNYNSLKADELKSLVAERGLETEGNKKADLVAALQSDDAADMKASDFIERVKAAQTQDELDEVGALYDAQDRELKSVENAIDKRQSELDNPPEDDTNDNQ